MLNKVGVVLKDVHTLIYKNYTHIKAGFRILASYSQRLIRENYSVQPKAGDNKPKSYH